MSRVFVHGSGAVSPAGWGTSALMKALDESAALPTQELSGAGKTFRVRNAPTPSPRPACLAHPRLRRVSAISQYATAAAFEALGDLRKPEHRLGIVVGVHAASIRYSERFYGDVLRDPATAPPVLFPETVINAPASHLAASLGSTHITYSVLGDQTAFVQALLIGAGWLADDRADIVLVIGAEETDWTVSASANLFSRDVICAEGAGALCLMREPSSIELESISDPALFSGRQKREPAAKQIASEFLPGVTNDLLCDGITGSHRWDAAESTAWREWAGARLSPKRILGEGLSAATAWQFVAAAERLRAQKHPAAVISAIGSNQQAIAGRLRFNEQN